jgi:cytochrome b561
MNKYPFFIRALHWLTVALVIVQILFGFLMEDWAPLFYGHIIIGSTLLLISVLRLTYRKKLFSPSKPQNLNSFQWKLAKFGHVLLYTGLIFVPISGALATIYEGIFEEVHETMVFLFIGLIIGHILMVIKHLVFDKVNLIERINL